MTHTEQALLAAFLRGGGFTAEELLAYASKGILDTHKELVRSEFLPTILSANRLLVRYTAAMVTAQTIRE